MVREPAFALILAGGGGTRLWPASRRTRPKQLLTLGGPESLLAATHRRLRASFEADRILVVTAADQAEGVRAALPALPTQNLVIEPAARNTAAAVGLGTVHVARRAGDNATVAVFPADHHIADETSFAAAVGLALAHAPEAIVTIGLRPTHPETGFGYIQRGPGVAPGVHAVARFVEKPTVEKAAAYVAGGEHLWNAGMFFFTTGALLAAARTHLPDLGRALDQLRAADDLTAAERSLYPAVPAISIDHGIMEKAGGLRVVPASFGWNDVGSWAALGAIRALDDRGNVVAGDTVVKESRGSIVLGEPGAPLVAVLGADDLVVVATRDAVLVTRKDRAQDVRTVVDALSAAGRKELL
jgi:mannose-1-phosphate guanylyltransferase